MNTLFTSAICKATVYFLLNVYFVAGFKCLAMLSVNQPSLCFGLLAHAIKRRWCSQYLPVPWFQMTQTITVEGSLAITRDFSALVFFQNTFSFQPAYSMIIKFQYYFKCFDCYFFCFLMFYVRSQNCGHKSYSVSALSPFKITTNLCSYQPSFFFFSLFQGYLECSFPAVIGINVSNMSLNRSSGMANQVHQIIADNTSQLQQKKICCFGF